MASCRPGSSRAQEHGLDGPWVGLDSLPAAITMTTGSDGRFRMTGIGRDRIADLIISGPTIATIQLYVLDGDGPALTTTSAIVMGTPDRSRTTYHSRKFEYVAAPTKPIEGVIRDKDTGRPIAGIVLHAKPVEAYDWAMGVEATTDAAGHYRLTGLTKAPAYQLYLGPKGVGVPYPKSSFHVSAESPGLEPVKFDVALERGVVVRGRVTDKETGKPVTGHILAYTFADDPHVSEFPGYREWRGQNTVRIKEDGHYEIVTLPGRGIIACQTDPGPYRIGVGAEAIKGYDPKIWETGGFATVPELCAVRGHHVLSEVNLDPKVGTATVGSSGRSRPCADTDRDRSREQTGRRNDGKRLDGSFFRAGIPARLAHDRDPRPRSVASAPRNGDTCRPQARWINLLEGRRDRSAHGSSPTLGNDHRQDR